MAAILHHRFADNFVRLETFVPGRNAAAGRPLARVWSIGPDGVLACRWTPASMVRSNPARGPAA